MFTQPFSITAPKWIGYNHSIRRQIQIYILYEANETWLIAAGCLSEYSAHTNNHTYMHCCGFIRLRRKPLCATHNTQKLEYWILWNPIYILYHTCIASTNAWTTKFSIVTNGIGSVQVLMMELYFRWQI